MAGWLKLINKEKDILEKSVQDLIATQKEQTSHVEVLKENAAKAADLKEYKDRVQLIERNYINRIELEAVVDRSIKAGLAPVMARLDTLPCRNGTVCKIPHKEE